MVMDLAADCNLLVFFDAGHVGVDLHFSDHDVGKQTPKLGKRNTVFIAFLVVILLLRQ